MKREKNRSLSGESVVQSREELLKKAYEMPGVADMVKTYEALEEQSEGAQGYFHVLRPTGISCSGTSITPK